MACAHRPGAVFPQDSLPAPAMQHLLGLLSVVAGLALVARADVATAVDFYTDVLYEPAGAWRAESEIANSCGTPDYYTTMVNASITVNFTGAS